MAATLKPPAILSSARSWWRPAGITIADEYITPTILMAATALIVIWLVWILTTKHNRRRPQPPPLPPSPSVFPLVGNLLSLDPELHSYFVSLAKLYGPIFTLRLGKKVGIVITSPDLAREVLKTNDTVFANRDVTAAAREAMYGGKDILWSSYGDQWRMLRKICVRELVNPRTLDSLHSLRRKEVRNTVRRLYKGVGSPVNIGEQVFLTMWNVITGMIWGGSGAAAMAVEGRELKQMVNEITKYLGTPNVSDFCPGLGWLDVQGIGKKTRVLAERFDMMIEKMIEERREKKIGEVGDNKDFLEYLVRLQEQDSKLPFTAAHLKALLMDVILGGTDTTSTTLEFALAELMSNPKILKKAIQELDTVVGKDNVVEESHISELTYFCTIMKEVLRLHPTGPLLVPHCPSKSCVVGGYTIPKEAQVFINVWAIHRDPNNWVNPLEFCPERFLNNKLDYSSNDFNYLPFGSGRRRCVGITVAERMFMFLLASLVHSFDWKLAQGEKVNLSENFGIVLKMKILLVVIPTPRLSDPLLYE